MLEPEIELLVSCPCCGKQSFSDFRLTVVADALQTNQLRLYANCHAAGWDASDAELARIRSHFNAIWATGWEAACLAV